MLRVVLGEFVAGCITSPIVQSFEAASNNLDVGLNGQGLDIQEATDVSWSEPFGQSRYREAERERVAIG